MSKADLKAAMESLEVRKPLRLQLRAPSAEPTPVEISTQVGNPTRVDNQTGVGKTAPVLNSTQVTNTTGVENHTPVVEPTQVAKETPVGKPTEVNVALSQDSSVVLEARAANGLERGYTRIPNSILMRLVSGVFTRNEIKLALLIARFTISFQRKLAPLSKTVLARRTELREPAILEAISGLVKKGLIEKKPGDQNRPNMLGLILPPDWDIPQVAFSTPAPVEKHTPAGVGNPTYFKDNIIYKNNSSLSELPEKLQIYFSDLKPERKKESEQRAFEEIRKDFSIAEITKCFDYLKRKGLPGGDPCHSPMAYLATAMRGVLEIVESQESLEKTRAESKSRQEADERARAEQSAREEREWELKERAFNKTYSGGDRQNEVIGEICRNKHFPLRGAASRALAISAWFSGLTAHERQEVTE